MEKQISKLTTWLRTSITTRMLVVGILALLLLIPLSFVKDLITERAERQKDVIKEINSKWGNEVVLSGPILKIPYTVYDKKEQYDPETKKTVTEIVEQQSSIFLLPDNLFIETEIDSKPLKRSIYKSVVFSSESAFQGSFPRVDLSQYELSSEQIHWNKATIILQCSNLKGINNQVEIALQSEVFSFLPRFSNAHLKILTTNAITSFEDMKDEQIPFSFKININGSESVKFIPIGKVTTTKMTSDWPSPSFDGNFLPEDGSRMITENGFEATWRILQINRQFEQIFIGDLPNLQEFAYGTNFIIPVDDYQKSERTAKYGFIVIGLTLLVFLLIQIMSKIYIHPFQYLIIGLALIMFYTLLISISEHSNYFQAYLISGISVVALIGMYSIFIFKNYTFPLFISISLGTIFSFIYIIIQLENYALLIGSIGLFVILAIIMFVSRKIDWKNESS